jgi:hypothetical protein
MSFASYTQLLADIYTLTARPDLAAETALAVRKATMKFHMADFWVNDLATVPVTLPVLPTDGSVSFRYTLDLTDAGTYPRLRKLAQIKEYNTVLTGQEIKFARKESDMIQDAYLLEDINYWAQTGRSVAIRSNKVLVQIAVDYYKYPNVVPANYDSWIADQFDMAVIEEAASNIFSIIGKDAEAKRLGDRFGENLHMITMAQVG